MGRGGVRRLPDDRTVHLPGGAGDRPGPGSAVGDMAQAITLDIDDAVAGDPRAWVDTENSHKSEARKAKREVRSSVFASESLARWQLTTNSSNSINPALPQLPSRCRSRNLMLWV